MQNFPVAPTLTDSLLAILRASLRNHTMQRGVHCRKRGAPLPSHAAKGQPNVSHSRKEEPSQILVIVLYIDMLQMFLNIP